MAAALLLIVAGILCLLFIAWPLGLILGAVCLLFAVVLLVPGGGYGRRGWY